MPFEQPYYVSIVALLSMVIWFAKCVDTAETSETPVKVRRLTDIESSFNLLGCKVANCQCGSTDTCGH